MTNGKLRRDATGIVERLLELLSEGYIQREILTPLDEAGQSYPFERQIPFSHQRFIDTTAGLVRHLYRNGLRIPQDLSESESHVEAVNILETGYQSKSGSGYDSAFLDASQDGLEVVIAGIIEAVKTREKQSYTRWVFASQVDPHDRKTRICITEILLEKLEPIATASLKACSAAQLVDHYPQLLMQYIATENLCREMFSL